MAAAQDISRQEDDEDSRRDLRLDRPPHLDVNAAHHVVTGRGGEAVVCTTSGGFGRHWVERGRAARYSTEYTGPRQRHGGTPNSPWCNPNTRWEPIERASTSNPSYQRMKQFQQRPGAPAQRVDRCLLLLARLTRLVLPPAMRGARVLQGPAAALAAALPVTRVVSLLRVCRLHPKLCGMRACRGERGSSGWCLLRHASGG